MVAVANQKARAAAIVKLFPKVEGKPLTETIVKQIVSLVRAGEMEGGRTAENIAAQYRQLTGHKYKDTSVPGMVGQLRDFCLKNGIAEKDLPAEFTIIGQGKKGRRAKQVAAGELDGLLDSLLETDDESADETAEDKTAAA